jgi:hypothetical protein
MLLGMHEDVSAVVSQAIPPRPVPWRQRFFWFLILRIARHHVLRDWVSKRWLRQG